MLYKGPLRGPERPAPVRGRRRSFRARQLACLAAVSAVVRLRTVRPAVAGRRRARPATPALRWRRPRRRRGRHGAGRGRPRLDVRAGRTPGRHDPPRAGPRRRHRQGRPREGSSCATPTTGRAARNFGELPRPAAVHGHGGLAARGRHGRRARDLERHRAVERRKGAARPSASTWEVPGNGHARATRRRPDAHQPRASRTGATCRRRGARPRVRAHDRRARPRPRARRGLDRSADLADGRHPRLLRRRHAHPQRKPRRHVGHGLVGQRRLPREPREDRGRRGHRGARLVRSRLPDRPVRAHRAPVGGRRAADGRRRR